jgi:hypothetical protein
MFMSLIKVPNFDFRSNILNYDSSCMITACLRLMVGPSSLRLHYCPLPKTRPSEPMFSMMMTCLFKELKASNTT